MTENSGSAIEGTLYSDNGEGVVRMKGRYETDIADLWTALTNPNRLERDRTSMLIGGLVPSTG